MATKGKDEKKSEERIRVTVRIPENVYKQVEHLRIRRNTTFNTALVQGLRMWSRHASEKEADLYILLNKPEDVITNGNFRAVADYLKGLEAQLFAFAKQLAAISEELSRLTFAGEDKKGETAPAKAARPRKKSDPPGRTSTSKPSVAAIREDRPEHYEEDEKWGVG